MIDIVPQGFKRHVSYTYRVERVSYYWDRKPDVRSIDFLIEPNEDETVFSLVSAHSEGQNGGHTGSPLHSVVGAMEAGHLDDLKTQIDEFVELHRAWLTSMYRDEEAKEQAIRDARQEYLDMHADLVARAVRIPVEELRSGDFVIHSYRKAGKRAWSVTDITEPGSWTRQGPRQTFRMITKLTRTTNYTSEGYGVVDRYYKPGSTVLAVRQGDV